MAKAKQIALGTTILQGTTTITMVGQIDPPPRKRQLVDGVDLTDTFDVPLLGIEERSEFSLTQYWHPGETEDEALDTLFCSKAEVTVKIVTPHATPKNLSVPAKVIGLGPESLQPNGTYKRKVDWLRTGTITVT